MENEKFNQFINSVSEAFRSVSEDVTGFNFAECAKSEISEDRKFSVVIGIVGKNKGRILFEAGSNTIKAITETMNEGPFNNMMDMYFCIAEFANMFCGNAVTKINNKFRGSDLRLTPPAIFAGTAMEITTPSIHSTGTYYKCEHGIAVLDIGFEGM